MSEGEPYAPLPSFEALASNQDSANHKSQSRKQRTAAFAFSFLGFLLINAAVAIWHPISFDPGQFPYKGWSWWTVYDLNHSHVTPNVVLLGSSLMVAAIAECDANFQKRTLDLSSYRGAKYLDHSLQERFSGSFNTLDLSAPGQLPSDAYLTLKATLKGNLNPKVIIYGVAPRDFLDGTLQSPSDTEAFKFLQRHVDIKDCAFDFFSSPLGKLDWLLQSAVALYRDSLDCRMTLEKTCRQLISHNGIFNLPENAGLANSLRQDYRPANIEAGMFLALQTTPERMHAVNTNLREYKDRYKNPDRNIYAAQLRFVARIAQLCRQKNISLVLVDMPITEQNIHLLKPAIYANYKSDLASVAKSNNVTLLEMCKFDQYTPDDYKDTVHLNGFGGKKFVDNLVDALFDNQALKNELLTASVSKNPS